MSMRVLFNGVVLSKPGGASRVDASLFASAGLGGVGVVGLIGEADGGEPNTIQIFSTPELARKTFRSGPLADAAALAFQPTNDPRVQSGAQKLVCIKVNQSTAAAKTLQGSGTANAMATAAATGPYNLDPGQTVVVSVDGAGAQTATFAAAAALVNAGGSGPYTLLANGDVLSVVTDAGNGGLVQNLTLAGLSAKTAAEIAGILNPLVQGGSFVDNAGTLRFVSDTRGTASRVQVTGGTANGATKLNFPTGLVSGTGNVANIDAVTATEAGVVIAAAVTGLSASGNPLQLLSNTVGSGSIQVTGASTALGFGFSLGTVYTAASPVNVLTLTARDFGVHTNKISAQVSDVGGGKILEFVFEDGTKKTTETSALLGSTAEFTVLYTGNGSAATMTLSATQLTTSLTGASDGSVNLTVPFSTYSTLQELLNYINAQPGYTATAVTTNPYTFNPAQLDYVTAVNIKTTYSAYAKLFRVVEWVNANSALVKAARVSGGPTAPLQTVGKVLLTGGARGTSANSNWQTAFNSLGSVRVNEVTPLIEQDLSALGLGSTATFASVAAMTDAHVAYYSSTLGKSERQAYIGMKATKSQFLAQAAVLNSIHSCLTSHKVTVLNSQATLQQLPEWAFAVICAGTRAGADLGEPLTWKYIRANDITQDASWNPLDDGNDLILGGCLLAEKVPSKGIRIMKGITTYTREDNDAYTEESVVMGWKNIAFELRTHLEDLFIGRKVSPSNITAVKQAASAKLSQLRAAGQIVDSVYPDGSRDLAFRNLTVSASLDTVSVSVVVSPVEGINFILNSIYLVPAQISG